MSEVASEEGNLHAFVQSFVMIVVSEIGDKTFLIAAIMASRHPRITVFAGAFASLVVMSVLSAALGRAILGFIPKVWTLWAAAALFVIFGVKMVQEALAMPSSHLQDEMREVEEELEEDAAEHDLDVGAVPLEALEEGRSLGPLENGLSGRPSRPTSPAPPGPRAVSRSPSRTRSQSIVLPGGKALGKGPSEFILRVREGTRNGIQMMTNPVFAQAFILTFLGEWGDRSQITTIAMAGAHSIPVIAFGTILGHSLCTFLAVMGGRYLSTKISVKHISLLGAFAFFIFAILYAVEAWHTPLDATDAA
ncbi:GCR1-dependent translation factor 1 [Vanrija albida]|uniref:GDT1 family protein n=1 Tax=Vanrija albida TaxID=181172 RepID=A0ABR3Q2L6_9TREE